MNTSSQKAGGVLSPSDEPIQTVFKRSVHIEVLRVLMTELAICYCSSKFDVAYDNGKLHRTLVAGPIHSHVRHARTHADEQVARIAASIAEFGFVNPILAGPALSSLQVTRVCLPPANEEGCQCVLACKRSHQGFSCESGGGNA
jgi:hypothetical protein